jgi:hypothetical protein
MHKMKTILLIPMACVVSCAAYTKTEFSEYRGGRIQQGSGGSVRNVQGIDIWTTGTPDRKYRVIGTINQTHNDNNSVMSFVAGTATETAVIDAAKNAGGDAIMTISANSQVTGFTSDGIVSGSQTGSYGYGGYSGSGTYYGSAQTRANTQTQKLLAVLKYY